jgi:hypothetical protein
MRIRPVIYVKSLLAGTVTLFVVALVLYGFGHFYA